MILTEDERIDKYAEQCVHCTHKSFSTIWRRMDLQFMRIQCKKKRKSELTKTQRNKSFINRLENAEKELCVCVDAYKYMKVMIMRNRLCVY